MGTSSDAYEINVEYIIRPLHIQFKINFKVSFNHYIVE